MGDYLRGHVGIDQLKPQHEFFDAIGLETQLRENTTYIALLSLEEVKSVLEDIDSPKPKSPFMKKVFSVADPISPYAGVRKFITASRYGASNMKMISMGIGQQGINSGIVKGMKFCILFSVAYRTVEFIFKDEYTLADFLGNIAVDMAKTAVAAFASWVTGAFLSSVLVAGASIIVVAGIMVFVGLLVAIGLNYLDDKYGISKKVIDLMKEAYNRERAPVADVNKFLHDWGRYGRG
ncbi:hypothetical protein C5467_22100 [Photorhabdus khanii subsp. guanajuatensis]|uniref:Uncharacterized protein n=2 Tax=Photorhabdus khanii TaxID=1004150 RepID=A0A4R4IXD0_9GAMM|nr:hypothetical protein C5467_22100 [Photorhabdus khanii subsp. guanajuatensis]